jgi:hypothetical protein
MRSRFESIRWHRYGQASRALLALVLLISALPLLTVASPLASAQDDQVIVGLITKTESNPFFVKMKEGAQAQAKKDNVKLLTASGKTDLWGTPLGFIERAGLRAPWSATWEGSRR